MSRQILSKVISDGIDNGIFYFIFCKVNIDLKMGLDTQPKLQKWPRMDVYPTLPAKPAATVPANVCLGFYAWGTSTFAWPIAGLGSGLNEVSGEMLWVLRLLMLGRVSFLRFMRVHAIFGTHFHIDALYQRIKKLRVYLLWQQHWN